MTGILIIARLGSTRLHQKHLIKVNEKSFIEWLVIRLSREFAHEIGDGNVKLILATSAQPENKKFENLFAGSNISVFYGNDSNIPLRQIECAQHYKFDDIISVDGDDILCSTKAARRVYEQLKQSPDALIKTSGLPLGMNLMGYSKNFLSEALTRRQGKLETGWGRIFDGKKTVELEIEGENDPRLRMTLDYKQDADFFSEVIKAVGENIVTISDRELIGVIIKKRLYKINESLHEEYMANFERGKESEEK